MQSQLTDAKTYYDLENNNDGQNVPMVLEDSKYIKQEYSQIFAKDDDLGSRQALYLEKVPLFEPLMNSIRENVVEEHKVMIKKEMSQTQKSPEQIEYDDLEQQLEQIQQELAVAKKPQIKQLQTQYDTLTEKLKEVTQRLPPNPIDQLPLENLFKFTLLYEEGENANVA